MAFTQILRVQILSAVVITSIRRIKMRLEETTGSRTLWNEMMTQKKSPSQGFLLHPIRNWSQRMHDTKDLSSWQQLQPLQPSIGMLQWCKHRLSWSSLHHPERAFNKKGNSSFHSRHITDRSSKCGTGKRVFIRRS